MTVYEGDPWHADEDENGVRFHRGDMQVLKAPRRGTPFAEYWPGPQTIRWMLDALNERERSKPLSVSVNE